MSCIYLRFYQDLLATPLEFIFLCGITLLPYYLFSHQFHYILIKVPLVCVCSGFCLNKIFTIIKKKGAIVLALFFPTIW